ncbi:MAG: hypothetical protein ACOYNI_07510 [Acidimicrobiia bacterium]
MARQEPPDSTHQPSRRAFLRSAASGAAIAAGGLVTAACVAPPEITAPRAPQGSDAFREQWAIDFLSLGGWDITRDNLAAMKAWQLAEGTRARFNPLATTRRRFGATNFNKVGVKNYPTYADGLAATIETINLRYYDFVRQELTNANDAMGVAWAVALSPWGTRDGVIKVLERRGPELGFAR